MSHPIPLIRPRALLPILSWMRMQGIPVEKRLRLAGLPAGLSDEPDRPVALMAAVRLLRDASRSEGLDVAMRLVSESSVAELGALARAVSGSRTPRQAFARMAEIYAVHSSHEVFGIVPGIGGAVVRHAFTAPLDDETLHACQQYVAALVRAIAMGPRPQGEAPLHVAMAPHPTAGLRHLRDVLHGRVETSADRTLAIFIPNRVLDRPYARPERDAGGAAALGPIRGDGSLTGSLLAILPAMMEDGTPSVADLAALAGASARTFQRRLAEEGASHRLLVERVRRERACESLAKGRDPVGVVAAEVGFSAQSSLTRAMRRWEAVTPTELRRGRS